MSKRRPDIETESDEIWRSTRSRVSNGAATSTTEPMLDVQYYNDPSTLCIQHIVKMLQNYKTTQLGEIPSEMETRAQMTKLLDEFPESSTVPSLKYANQMIEIPIFDALCNDVFTLKYNESFPFLREPMSISVQGDSFVENVSSYTCFKKIILKSVKIQPCVETLNIMHDDLGIPHFYMSCFIITENGLRIQSLLNDQLLQSSNILLRMQHVWYIGSEAIKRDVCLTTDDKTILINELWGNFARCFHMMDIIDVAVNVTSSDNIVAITNILHCYFTQ